MLSGQRWKDSCSDEYYGDKVGRRRCEGRIGATRPVADGNSEIAGDIASVMFLVHSVRSAHTGRTILGEICNALLAHKKKLYTCPGPCIFGPFVRTAGLENVYYITMIIPTMRTSYAIRF